MVQRVYEVGAGRLSVSGASSVGVRYRANFDVLYVDETLPMVVVADGMGDGRGSTVAGRTAVDVFTAGVRDAADGLGPDALRAAAAAAQERVGAAGADLGELTGCTLTAFVATPGGRDAWIVHLGDSRAYRRREGLLELLTTDHTAAWLGAVYGWYPADSPSAAAARYHLHRFVGHPGHPEPDVLNVSLRPGDRYLLCTDGLAEQISYDQLGRLVGSGDPDAATRQMMDDALAAGGRDNATAALITVAAP